MSALNLAKSYYLKADREKSSDYLFTFKHFLHCVCVCVCVFVFVCVALISNVHCFEK